MNSWHKDEAEEASGQRAIKRDKEPRWNVDTATTGGDETTREESKRERLTEWRDTCRIELPWLFTPPSLHNCTDPTGVMMGLSFFCGLVLFVCRFGMCLRVSQSFCSWMQFFIALLTLLIHSN